MCDIRGRDTEGDPPILNPLSLLLEVAGAPGTPALTGVLGLATQSSSRVPGPPTAGPPGLRIPGFFHIPGSSWPSFSPALFAGSRRRWGGGRLFGLGWAGPALGASPGTLAGGGDGRSSWDHRGLCLRPLCSAPRLPRPGGTPWGHSEPRTPFLLLRSTVTD